MNPFTTFCLPVILTVATIMYLRHMVRLVIEYCTRKAWLVPETRNAAGESCKGLAEFALALSVTAYGGHWIVLNLGIPFDLLVEHSVTRSTVLFLLVLLMQVPITIHAISRMWECLFRTKKSWLRQFERNEGLQDYPLASVAKVVLMPFWLLGKVVTTIAYGYASYWWKHRKNAKRVS